VGFPTVRTLSELVQNLNHFTPQASPRRPNGTQPGLVPPTTAPLGAQPNAF
jgi:hypothetical protein